MPEHQHNNNAEHDADLVTCDICAADEQWTAATHLPNGIACRKPSCVILLRARLAHIVGEDN